MMAGTSVYIRLHKFIDIVTYTKIYDISNESLISDKHNTSIALNFAMVQEKHIKGSEKEEQKQHVALVAMLQLCASGGTE